MVIKNQIVNSFMKNGKKYTGEKILLKFSKLLQKSTQKNFQTVIQLAIVSITPAFKLNEQILKKGKRKSKKTILSFIVKDSLRIINALKSIQSVAQKDKNFKSFFIKFNKETLNASNPNGLSIEQKTKMQNQILLNKRYLAKFRW
jgi:ribosomal protein S7